MGAGERFSHFSFFASLASGLASLASGGAALIWPSVVGWPYLIFGGAGALVSLAAMLFFRRRAVRDKKTSIIGLDINGDGPGPAVDILSVGQSGAPSVGASSHLTVEPESAETIIGTRITSINGQGGMRVTQIGPGVGFKSTVVVGRSRPE